ncbi:hypothetical protein JCM10449v2_004811 [Rhodotorula kratochvilovae]
MLSRFRLSKQKGLPPPVNPTEEDKARLRGWTVEGGFHGRLTFDLALRLDLPNLFERIEYTKMPVTGRWHCEVKATGGGLRFTVRHGRLKEGALARKAARKMRLVCVFGTDEVEFASATFDDAPVPHQDDDGILCIGFDLPLTPLQVEAARNLCGKRFSPSQIHSFKLEFHLSQLDIDAVARVSEPMPPLPSVSAVRLFFPSQKQEGREAETWTTAEFLCSVSPYIGDLLASGSSESMIIGSKRLRVSPPPVAAADTHYDFDDSDEETDDLLFQAKKPKLFDVNSPPEFPYQHVTISTTAYSTYYAVLHFLQTGKIRFAPLQSACKPNNPDGIYTRAEHIRTIVEQDATLPYPISPKSVFRLAHFLDTTEDGLAHFKYLKQLCLAELGKWLSVETCATELLSPTSLAFDEWRAVVRKYVSEHREDARKTTTWDKVRMAAGAQDNYAKVLMEVLSEI